MITTDQRKRYWVEWNAVLEQRPNLTREEFHAQHNLPASTKDFTRAHFDTFLAACAAITKPADLKPQLRALDQPKARLLHKILVEQAAQLDALYQSDPSLPSLPSVQFRTGLKTIEKISRDKFRNRLPADLSDSPRSVFNSRYSELDMLLFTVARQISQLRQERGWTVHELLCNSGLADTCQCADCRKGRVRRSARTVPALEPELADNVPF